MSAQRPTPKHSAHRYAALLLGINVGGNRIVPMADLKKLLEKEGWKNVKTLLASGNVLFDAPKADPRTLEKTLEAAIAKKFGFDVGVIVRMQEELATLVESDPFKSVKVTPLTRLYVTFLSGDAKTGALEAGYVSPDKSFRILRVTDGEVCGFLTLTEGARTPDAMAILAKAFGKKITTRNWNTVLKLVA